MKSVPNVRASYDAAGYDQDNEKHWSLAGAGDADSVASPEVRAKIRNRARYEILENNSYGRGIVETWVQDCIGTGPRLQLNIDSDTEAAAVEQEWGYWSRAVRLSQKIRTMTSAEMIDGASIGKMVTNPPLPADVKLDLQVVDVDRLTSPFGGYEFENPRLVDGIYLDEYGNPIRYLLLKDHPGSDQYNGGLYEFETYHVTRNHDHLKLSAGNERLSVSEGNTYDSYRARRRAGGER